MWLAGLVNLLRLRLDLAVGLSFRLGDGLAKPLPMQTVFVPRFGGIGARVPVVAIIDLVEWVECCLKRGVLKCVCLKRPEERHSLSRQRLREVTVHGKPLGVVEMVGTGMNIEVREQPTAERVELPGLLAMRCYAALSIVLVHLIALPKLPLPAYLNFIPLNFGYGVPLFYVVSAFGLTVGYAERLNSRAELTEFYLRRFLRIAPLFYFIMLFYIPFCWLMWGTVVPISQFISSGLFIFNFIPQHVTGFVAASWSIGVEMAFYAIFPLLVFAVTGLARALLFFAIAVFISINWTMAFEGSPLTQFAQSSLIAHMFNFAAGIVGYYIWRMLRHTSARTGGIVLTAGLLTIVCLIFFPWLFGSLGHGVRAVWAMALSAVVVGVSVHPLRGFVNPTAKLLGNASFSLYLWHPVIITILDRWGVYRSIYAGAEGLLPFLVSLSVTLAVLVPLALTSYRLIERPGMKIALRRPAPIGLLAKAH